MNKEKKQGFTKAQKIALGATGIAVTAGAIAAGVAMSNPKTRKNITKKLDAGVKKVKNTAGKIKPFTDQVQSRIEEYRSQSVPHKIGINRKKSTTKKAKRA